MFAKECAQCGGRFQAKRDTAKYCSGRCRQRAHVAPTPPPPRREGAPVVALPPKAPAEDGLLARVRGKLEKAGRLDTWEGAAAVQLATVLDSGIQDTGSSISALHRELRTAMDRALEGANAVESPLDQIRRQREQRAG